uniref:B-cell receptor CD22 first Ig-like domain-containing protein n=1 Tax=Terrapene triunguis TaxID=2587831 RepID=A0A674J256_9SAUR
MHHLPLAPISVTLLFPGFLCQCDPPVEVPESLIAWTGACLSIPCRYQSCLLNPRRSNNPTINSLAWYLTPGYDPEKKNFSGTVLYKHSAAISPDFAGRVRFLGELERDCSLQLSDLQASENGLYGLRPITSNPRQKPEERMWMTKISVNVMGKRESPGLPCRNSLKIHIPPHPLL